MAKSNALTLPGVDDAEGFRSTLDAMAIVGLNEAEQDAILQNVAAVLHLGNILFRNNEDEQAVLADAAAESALMNVSLLLQVGTIAALLVICRIASCLLVRHSMLFVLTSRTTRCP